GKLVLLFVVMAFIFVFFVSSGFHYFINHHFKDNVQPHIVKYLEYVLADLGSPPDPQRARQLADELNLEIHIINGQQQWSSQGQPINLADLKIKHSHTVDNRHYELVEYDDREYLMTKLDDSTLLFTVPRLRPERSSFRGFLPLVILLAILFLLYHATRRLFAPIETIQAGVKRFGEGDLNHRITVHRRDELGELADNFNDMADEIQQMLEAKRQLLLAISHELRSPLTRAKVASEFLDDDKQKTQINRELNEMETLIEELLETERLSSRHTVLNKTSQNLQSLINEVKNSYFEQSPVELAMPDEPVTLDIDAARIKLLIKNLIDNALRHTPADKPAPKVTVRKDTNYTIIEVVDNGTGIETRHLPHLTEPFYRADASRQRETGGYGLGLYLCRMIAEAHGGRLTINSSVGKGTTVTVDLPC
ncbi:MAG: HAMP domain-containing sensor histidine kinase, partial [Gammaproteobacteria bacterium]|nr:HAMP domain-containing sensor histidine kinase [Gammaproteobacteria bacterium]